MSMSKIINRVVRESHAQGVVVGRGHGKPHTKQQELAVAALEREIKTLKYFARMLVACGCANDPTDTMQDIATVKNRTRRCDCSSCEAARWLEKHDV